MIVTKAYSLNTPDVTYGFSTVNLAGSIIVHENKGRKSSRIMRRNLDLRGDVRLISDEDLHVVWIGHRWYSNGRNNTPHPRYIDIILALLPLASSLTSQVVEPCHVFVLFFRLERFTAADQNARSSARSHILIVICLNRTFMSCTEAAHYCHLSQTT